LKRASSQGSALSGYGLILTAALLWGLIGIFSKGILATGVGALEIAFWRALIAGLAFLLHASLRRSLTVRRRRDAAAFAAFAIFGVSIFYSSFVLAIDAGGVSLAAILLYSAPAFVILFAWLLLGEKLTLRKVGLVLMALAGVAFVSRDSGMGMSVSPISLSWGLLAGLSYASYYIFGKWVLGRYQPATIYALVLPLGALGLLPFVTFHAKTAAVWGLLLVLSLLSTYLAYLLYYTGLRQVEASRAVLVATVEPLVASLLAALLFAERFGVLGMLGGGLILAAALLSARQGSKTASAGGRSTP